MAITMGARASGFALLLVLFALAHQCHGYPAYWVKLYASKTCTLQPTAKVAGSPHGTPFTDKTIILGAAGASGSVKTLCAGKVYQIQANFTTTRLGLLTATLGSFTGATAPCLNRIDLGGSKKTGLSKTFTATYTAPSTTGNVVFQITTAGPSGITWAQSTLTLPVAKTNCGKPLA